MHRVLETLEASLSLLARSPSTLIYSSDPLLFCVALVVSVMLSCFVFSVVMDNYSQVDRWWSVLPPLLIGFYCYRSPVLDARLMVMTLLSVAWGVRLTFNFWRKGGYNWHDEDYRWQPLKATIRPYPLWLLFNILFICIFQLTLLFLISSPVDVVYRNAGKVPLNTFDVLLLFAFVLLLTIETIADEQQWNFQMEKQRLKERVGATLTGDYKLGFLTHGLFQFSRHPNFFAEISLWWVMYMFGVNATGGEWMNWTLTGALLLTLLFQGSTTFTEKLSAQKYPEYAKYQQTTSRLLPWLPGRAKRTETWGAGKTSAHHASTATVTSGKAPPTSPKGGKKKATTTEGAVHEEMVVTPPPPKKGQKKSEEGRATSAAAAAATKNAKKSTSTTPTMEPTKKTLASPHKSNKPATATTTPNSNTSSSTTSPTTKKKTATPASASHNNNNKKAPAHEDQESLYEDQDSPIASLSHTKATPKKKTNATPSSSSTSSPKGRSSSSSRR